MMRGLLKCITAILFFSGLIAPAAYTAPLSGLSSSRQILSDSIAAAHPAFEERVSERELMVKEDIENYPNLQVKNRAVLEAMRRVPRHAFVPEDMRPFAYENRPLPIGYNQTISQPVIVAHMSALLELDSTHKVLEIGTGSGYQAAILAELCNTVFTMEIIPPLGERAAAVLAELGYEQVRVRVGNGYDGWPEEAPFDRMIVTCAPDNIPEKLLEQLAPGGRIIIPVGSQYQTQYMVLLKKNKNGKVSQENQYPVRFVPMTGEH